MGNLLAKLKKKDEKKLTDKDVLGHFGTVIPLTMPSFYYNMTDKDN